MAQEHFDAKNVRVTMLIILVLLLGFSTVQAVQLDGLKSEMKVTSTAAQASAPQTQAPPSQPAPQPVMVGGC